MRNADRLRYELLAVLATGGLLSGACGGKVSDETGAKGGGGAAATGGTTSYGGTTSFGGSGGTSAGGSGGISVGGSAGSGGDGPVILGTIDCSGACAAPNWTTCWKPWAVPTSSGDTADAGECPAGYSVDMNAYVPCTPSYTPFWYNGPIDVPSMPGWCCYDTGVACPGGRPFRVAGELRLADTCERSDWAKETGTLDADAPTRRALGAAWQRDALFEHASVAAFARLTLTLMALGAPADLIRDSQAASLDEIEHARICFGMASRFEGTPLGPTALHLDGALDDTSFESLLVSSIDEGCIGETLAALVAAEQAQMARDPETQRALARISEDEARHAALGWRIAKWVLARKPELRALAERTFARRLADERDAEPLPLGAEVEERVWNEHGRSSARQISSIRREGIERVILPCVASLCAAMTPAQPIAERSAALAAPVSELY